MAPADFRQTHFTQRSVAATKLIEREPTERTENPLFSPLAPVQLILSRGRHAVRRRRRRLQLVESIPELLAALVEVVE